MSDAQYDVAVSFAGENRDLVEEIVRGLQDAGALVFYDRDVRAELWGQDLVDSLWSTYRNKAFRTLMFVSAPYAMKAWPTHEMRAALAKLVAEPGEAYVLPVRLDDTELPGPLETIAYLDARDQSAEEIVESTVAHLLDNGRDLSGKGSRFFEQADQARRVNIRCIPTTTVDGVWYAPIRITNGSDYAINTVVAIVSDPGSSVDNAVEQMESAGEAVIGNMAAGEVVENDFDHLHFSEEPAFGELTYLGVLLFTDCWGQSWATNGPKWWRRSHPARVC